MTTESIPQPGLTPLAAAEAYIRLGWPVLPCRTNKAPCTPNGLKDATLELATVGRWLTQHGDRNGHVNWGILPPAGVLVLDADTAEASAGLLAAYPELQGAPRCRTPRGGAHFYLRWPPGRPAPAVRGGALPSVDIRGLGRAYVLAPPSVAGGRAYTWEAPLVAPGALPEAGAELVAALAPAPVRAARAAAVAPTPQGHELAYARAALAGEVATVSGAAPGQRNATLNTAAYSLGQLVATGGLERSEVEMELLAAAQACGLGETGARATIRSGIEAGLKQPRAIPALEPRAPPAQTPAPPGAPAELPPLVRDLAHAEALATLWRGRYRYAAHRHLWLTWTGRRWEAAAEQQVVDAAAGALRRHYARQLGAAKAQDEIKRLSGLIMETCTYSRLLGGLSFLAGREGFYTAAEAWDADPWLLNVNNGTVDLRTGELRRHDPADLCTRLAPVTFDAEAAGVAWETHLRYFLPNENVYRQVRRDLGLALVGASLREMLPIWYGAGANGKSTTARALQVVLDDYACQGAPHLLIQRKHEQHPAELADLAGRRVVFSIEVDRVARLDEVKVKWLTGGDRVKARHMYGDYFEFAATWSLLLLCNHKPVITGTDNAIWRRVRLVPWTVAIPLELQEPQEAVIKRLTAPAEASAILNYLLAGLRDWRQDHHWLAPEVAAATAEYREQQDRLSGFLADCCELRPHVSVGVGELYTAYTTWCEANGEEVLGKQRFGERLRDRGLAQVRRPDSGARAWNGIRLRLHRDKA